MRGTQPDGLPLWKARGQQHAHKPAPQSDAFPALGRRRSLSAPSLADAATGNSSSSTQQQQQPYSAVAGSGSRSAGNSRSSSEDRSRASKQQQVYQQKHALIDTNSNNQQQAASTAGLALLQDCHPWCDAALLQGVLSSVDGDVAAALDALEQMLPADGNSHRQQRPGGPQGSSSDSSSTSATDARHAAATGDSSAALQLWPAGPSQESGAAETQITRQLQRLHLQQHHSQTRQQQHQQQQQQQEAQLSGQQQQQQESAGQDTYHALRGDAVKLSHKFVKASKR